MAASRPGEDPAPRAGGSGSGGTGAASPPPPSGACDATLQIFTSTDATTYRSGQIVHIAVRFHNPGSGDCTILGDSVDPCWGRGAHATNSQGTEVWSWRGMCPRAPTGVGGSMHEAPVPAGGDAVLYHDWNEEECFPARPDKSCTGVQASPGTYQVQGFYSYVGVDYGNAVAIAIKR